MSSVDKRNFVYYSIKNWNTYPINIRALPKRKVIQHVQNYYLNKAVIRIVEC